MPFGPRPGGSGAMFPHPCHARFHLTGLSCGGLKRGTLSFTAFSFLFLGLFYPAVLCLSMFLLGFVPDCGIVLETNDQGGYPE